MVNCWWVEDERRTLCGETAEWYEECCSKERVSCPRCYDALPPEVQAQQYWWVRP